MQVESEYIISYKTFQKTENLFKQMSIMWRGHAKLKVAECGRE